MVWQKPNLANFERIFPDGNPEQPKQILQSDWSKNIRERLVLVSLGRKIDFRKPVMLSPVELRLRRGCAAPLTPALRGISTENFFCGGTAVVGHWHALQQLGEVGWVWGGHCSDLCRLCVLLSWVGWEHCSWYRSRAEMSLIFLLFKLKRRLSS